MDFRYEPDMEDDEAALAGRSDECPPDCSRISFVGTQSSVSNEKQPLPSDEQLVANGTIKRIKEQIPEEIDTMLSTIG